jgi:hypothetical protein
MTMMTLQDSIKSDIKYDSDSEILRCLQDASDQLQQALDRRQHHHEMMLIRPSIIIGDASSSSDHDNGAVHSNKIKVDNLQFHHDDPDAMAAAFLAQQVRQRQAQMRLPVDPWAQLLLRKKQCHWNNPCELVRSTCRQWLNSIQCCVTLHRDKVPTLAKEIQQHATGITWDGDDWHYSAQDFTGSQQEKRERIALYILALDAINFCFWPLTDDGTTSTSTTTTATEDNLLEYEQLAKALKSIAGADHNKNNSESTYALSPENLSIMTPIKMRELFAQHLDLSIYPIPNMSKRAMLWKELGDGLIRDYQGSALQFIEAAKGDASQMVKLIVTSFPGFRDEAYLYDRRMVFLKRAQILVGDINAALQLSLHGIDRLTTFADYRVPQLLRHAQVLEYSSSLATNVDHKVELTSGSVEEISIRAATVVAVEELVHYLNQHCPIEQSVNEKNVPVKQQQRYTDVQVDWYLWQVGEQRHARGDLKPFHRVRTHFY